MYSNNFYEALFDEGELTVFGKTIYATKPTKVEDEGRFDRHEFFVINPITKGKTRSIKGVQHFRNFMFEIDNDESGNTVPLQKQKEIITEAGLPWTTCVYSGGKSLHWIVSLATPLNDAIEYRIWWKMMVSILNKTANKLGYDLVFDNNVKDPSRFSRCPNTIRSNGKKQELISVRERRTEHEILKWFSDNNITFEEFTPKPSKFDISEVNENANDEERFEYITKVLMRNQEYVKGNMNAWQFTFARLCRRTGMAEDMTRYYVQRHCGEIDHRDPISSAYSDKYNNDEPIYVFSKADKIKYAQNQATQEQLEANQKIIDRGEATEELHINGVHNYIRVGTQFFHKDAENGELLPWDKTTMVMDFGTDHVKWFPETNKYKGFCMNVNFLEDIKNSNKMYNRFKKPEWTPSEGEWKTIEKLLRKVFSAVGEDQYEEGLDWIQHMITNPKQMLHCLILGSESREAGKDTFVLFLKMLLGKHNTYFSDIENFLKPFNGSYADKCLIALNEVKFSSINNGSMEKIKQYITQESVLIDEKYQVPYELDYHGKMVMLTNNVHDFMRIDDEENRFWIRTMPDLDKKKEYDPQFMQKLKDEVPHFVDFIVKRKLKWEDKMSRFYLPESITHTEELKRIKDNSKSSLYLEIHELLDNTFYERRGTTELYFTLSDIRDKLKGDVGPKQIKLCLQKEFKLQPNKMLRKNSFTNEERNTAYYHLERSKLYGSEDTTPGLDDAFAI